MHIVYVAPAFHATHEDIWMPAVVDMVERVAAVHEVTVICLRHPPRRPPFELAGATVITLGNGRRGGLIGRARVVGSGVAAVLRRHRQRPIDILHGLWADEPGAVATVCGSLLRRPSVVSVMGGELVAMPDISYGAALGMGGRLTVRVALRMAREVTAQSTPVLEMLRASGRTTRTRLLPLGVDLSLFRLTDPAPATAPRGETARVLFVGNLYPVKDPLMLLRAFARIAAERAVTLDVVGDGRMRDQVERAIVDLGLADRVVLHGQMSRAALLEMFRSASVLAITSRHESQSVVAVEAVASGVPVVGTRVGIVPDLGDAALVVPPSDEAAFADALASVLDDPVRAARMSVAARDVAKRFDLDVTTGRVLELYEELATPS